MKKATIFFCATLILLSGCGKKTETSETTEVSTTQFEAISCTFPVPKGFVQRENSGQAAAGYSYMFENEEQGLELSVSEIPAAQLPGDDPYALLEDDYDYYIGYFEGQPTAEQEKDRFYIEGNMADRGTMICERYCQENDFVYMVQLDAGSGDISEYHDLIKVFVQKITPVSR